MESPLQLKTPMLHEAHANQQRMGQMARGLLVFLVIMAVETAHGVLRGLFLVPLAGERAAAWIGWPMGLVLVLLVSYLMIGWTGLRGTGRLLALGAVWAVLTVGFEVAIGMFRGMDAAEIGAALTPFGGTIALSAAAMLLAPLIAARLRGSG
jgi:hypothetical protein